ncbi:thioredoxin domain-containing protein [Corynebacterium mastitidis]|uniref:Thioredoxin domain-containing protein n=1 Tax=Corynebacterium mastitidis TaxID=161890 RepID=A0ABU8P2V0_9CORY
MANENNPDHPSSADGADSAATPAARTAREASEARHAAPVPEPEDGDNAEATDNPDKPGPVPGWAKAAIGTLTVIALAAGAGGFLLGTTMGSGTDAEAASYIGGPGAAMRSLADVHRVNPDDPFAQGPTDAKVVVSYFGDLECPVCAAYKRDAEPRIIDEYVNSGQVRLEWNDFPLVNENSFLGAQAGRAAAAQGKFWEFTRAVYASFEGKEHPEHTLDDFVGFAEQAGVPDIARFRSDVESGKYAGTIVQAMTYASYVGVTSVPTFVINGVPVLGNDYDSLKEAIEQSLENGHPDQPPMPQEAAGQAEDPAAAQADQEAAQENQEQAPPEAPAEEQ